jgi:hypothetical protein
MEFVSLTRDFCWWDDNIMAKAQKKNLDDKKVMTSDAATPILA